ncbi:MAG TPA: AraC family transcriptional regulator N-terminal domain-containing protein [Pseudonocardiaceae bacterium]
MLDAALRLLRLVDHPADAPVLAPLIEREILWRLLTGPHGAMIRQIGLADSGLSHVSRSITWIRDNYAEPMRITVLARLAGMSESAFHRQAPIPAGHATWRHRGRRSHGRLRQPTQFNREYRRMFGAPPGRDAATLRAAELGALP